MATTQSPARVRASRALKLTGSIAVAALAVAGLSAAAADAAPTSTVVLSLRLTGEGAGGRDVMLRAVRVDGTLGARQVAQTVATATTDTRGAAVLRARPGALAGFVDGTGVVNFESQVLIDGAPRFTSFSRSWTGTAWVDRDAAAAATALTLSTREPPANANAGAAPAMTDVEVAPAGAASSEVPCYWYDDSAGDATTKVGEFHTGANTAGYFTYGETSDSDISAGYNYGAGWTLGGSAHVGNTHATYVRFNNHSNFHRQLRSVFQYIHWHLTLGPSCASSKRWGKKYFKVTPSRWTFGSSNGATIKGPFCRTSAGRRQFRPGDDFYRGSSRAYTYGAAANAWGASLSATSGYSKWVDMNWHFGKNKKVRHFLCGRPHLDTSKIVYAR